MTKADLVGNKEPIISDDDEEYGDDDTSVSMRPTCVPTSRLYPYAMRTCDANDCFGDLSVGKFAQSLITSIFFVWFIHKPLQFVKFLFSCLE